MRFRPGSSVRQSAEVNPLSGDEVLVDALRAWITHTEGNVPVPASSNLVKGVLLDEFRFAVGDETHGEDLANFCLFLINSGSGTGACSCGSGDSLLAGASSLRLSKNSKGY